MRQLYRLRAFLRPYWKQISLALLTILLATAANLIIPTIIQQVIDIGLARHELAFIARAAVVILGLGVMQAGLTYLQGYLSEWIASHIGYDLRNQLYDHIQQLSFSYHDHAQTGQLISRCIEDVRSIERFTGYGVVQLIQLSLLFAGIVVLLFLKQPQLAAIALLPMLPLIWITTNFGRRIGDLFLKVDNTLGDLSARLQENVSGVQVVRAFARESDEIQRFDRTNRRLYRARVTVLSEWSKIMPTSNLLVTVSTLLILWFGGNMVLQGRITIGEVVAFNGYLLLLAGPATQLTWLVNAAGEAVAGVQRTYEVLDTLPEIRAPAGARRPEKLAGQVEFRRVCFRYEGDSIPALEDIDLDVQPNQVVALIGPTGSGKTSLVNLIPRFYDVTEGAVCVDGLDVRSLDLVSLRRQIGIVLQTSLLFSDTIQANIAYGRPQASPDEIAAAARAAQAHEFIQEMPDGYQTIVGERGITLSGGQRQRVAIARALLMDPRILILDDSTSSVDTHTERLIQQALDHLMQGRTTFVIAHRLSTVRRADLILVMQDGRIVERGAHSQLLAAGGLYRQIYDLQLRDQENFHEEMAELGRNGKNRPAQPRSERQIDSN
jgi:ATP-binding cassette subfamily B multidrug efflux pump